MRRSKTGYHAVVILSLLLAVLVSASCGPDIPQERPEAEAVSSSQEDVAAPVQEEPRQSVEDCAPARQEAEDAQNDVYSEEALLAHKPNELGQVMVLMYHHIGETESAWVRTPQNFKQDLETLYEQGYRLVNLLDYVRGDMYLEAGKSPVVITFDDGGQGQLDFLTTDQGMALDPDCAVAILEDFCRDYPDFGRGATFYIYYPNPFGQAQYVQEKLEFLVQKGYEIGNHTYSHADLSRLSDQEAVQEIALHSKTTGEILPGYEVGSLALPFGQYPQNRDILAQGRNQGHDYKNHAVLMVGSNPAPSPFSIDFEPLAVPRVRASQTQVENLGIYDWLAYFKKNPEQRYISDGNPLTVTAPQEWADQLCPQSAADKEIYFYTLGRDQTTGYP